MRICYIVNSTCEDIHADLAYVSARFLRTIHPSAKICCVTDRGSAGAMDHAKHPLLGVLDEVIVEDVPVETLKGRNRWLKMRLPDYFSGDFLYADSDTLCIRKLDALFELAKPQTNPAFDIAVARDVNVRRPVESRRKGDEEFWPSLKEMGWRSPEAGYFNSGVIFFRDTAGSRNLCKRWAELWAISSASGHYYDQPAMNEAIRQCSPALCVLDPSYNAMILAKPRLVFTAKIVHLFASVASVLECTPFFTLVRDVRRTGTLTDSAIARVLADPFSWASRVTFMQDCWSKNPLGAARLILERFVRTGDLRFRKAV